MSDDIRQADSELERRLAALPMDKSPEADLWSAVQEGIHDERIASQVESMPQDVAPESDLWPEIAEHIRIDTNPATRTNMRRRTVHALLAACVSLIVIGGILLRGSFNDAVPDPITAQTPDTSGSSLPSDDFAVELLFPAGSGGADSDARAVYRDHIAMVREQRETIEASLSQFPNDTTLRELWRHAYETELALIDEADRTLTTI
jgi:hypothetical protein